MSRRFDELWKRVATTGSATITIHPERYKAIRQAIYKEKEIYQRARRAVDMPGFGKLTITREPVSATRMKLHISIPYNGAKDL